MRHLTLLVVLVLAACGPARDAAGTSPTAATRTAEPTASPARSAAASVAASASPAPAARLDDPPVTVAPSFPVIASLALRPAPADEAATTAVRFGIERYLELLNSFRDSGASDPAQLGAIGGRFRDAVTAGMKGSAAPGVKRKFALRSFRIDRFLAKPWETTAVVEVTATILDRDVAGAAPDQVETGRLRLTGDRPFVVDGWDDATNGWFNGADTVAADDVRRSVGGAVGFLLRLESWLPGSPVETAYGSGGETPYLRARHAYLNALDRATLASRTFADVGATIEKYETFGEIRDGLATVRLAGTVVTTDPAGREARRPFARRIVVLFGNWMPEVVDEELDGRWLSGGDLALAVRDHNFA